MNQLAIWRSYYGQKLLILDVQQFTLESSNLQILVSHVTVQVDIW